MYNDKQVIKVRFSEYQLQYSFNKLKYLRLKTIHQLQMSIKIK